MFLEVQCKVSTVSDDLGCRVICWCWSTVFSEVHSQHSHLPGNFRALHPSFCWQALWPGLASKFGIGPKRISPLAGQNIVKG